MKETNRKTLCVVLAALVLLLAAATVWLAVSRAQVTKEYEDYKNNYEDYKNKLQADYKLYKNIISQDEVEHILFGQPISPERNG